MYIIFERKVTGVYMSGEVQYGRLLVGQAETYAQAEEIRTIRHKRRGTPLIEIIIEEASS